MLRQNATPSKVPPSEQPTTSLEEPKWKDPRFTTLKEDFLHYLWRLQKFDHHQLLTTTGDPIQIVKSGTYHQDAGPDFLDARIRIGDTLWAGNVEMHLYTSDWTRHRHQENRAYDNVILHVVLEEDEVILRNNGTRIPCLELRNRIPAKLSSQYWRLQQQENWIPCQTQFSEVEPLIRDLWLDRLLVERLEARTQAIEASLRENQNNWEESFYYFLARNFGLRVNTIPFELLARSLPLSILRKHQDQLQEIEALLFGQAGMLEQKFQDAYPQSLKKTYQFLRKKYQLSPLRSEVWKFLRLRPASFPTIRTAQFAQLMHQSPRLFNRILEAQNEKDIQRLFAVKTSAYWKKHYRFDKASVEVEKTLGKSTIRLLIINTIAPFLFLYGKLRADQQFQDRALRMLESLAAEQNSIIRQWKALGLCPKSAYQTQALLQLKRAYCDQQNCLNCAIGNAILSE